MPIRRKTMKTVKISLSDIVKKYNIDPKIARRRLRNSGVRRPVAGWVFPAARRVEIVKVVRG
jgi:hypothetical protein